MNSSCKISYSSGKWDYAHLHRDCPAGGLWHLKINGPLWEKDNVDEELLFLWIARFDAAACIWSMLCYIGI